MKTVKACAAKTVGSVGLRLAGLRFGMPYLDRYRLGHGPVTCWWACTLLAQWGCAVIVSLRVTDGGGYCVAATVIRK